LKSGQGCECIAAVRFVLTFVGCQTRRTAMKPLALVTAFLMTCGSAYAASCKVEATSKKLAGAAMTSFMKKCETDAKSACDKSAADKKLAGAAKDSFTKKCVTDAVGS